jgi:integrase
MGIHRLSPVKVRNAKSGMHADGGGLYLQVKPGVDGLRRSWIFRYAAAGRERYCGLGSVHTVSLAEAREKARECRQLRLAGIDPIEHRDSALAKQRLDGAKVTTFAEAAATYIATHAAGWRSIKHLEDWQTTIATYAAPTIGALQVKDIDTDLVLRVLQPIWTVKHETASRLRGRIELILDAAKARGLRVGENPARWKGHLQNLLPPVRRVRKVQHFAALPYAEVPAFMAKLRQDETITARALEFLVLTAARFGEVRGVRFDEIDFDAGIWAVPAERTKANRVHRVPLCDRAVEILRKRAEARTGDLIFPGRDLRSPLGQMSLLQVLERLGHKGTTAHGFRSSFRDWAAEHTAFPREFAEVALAHTVGDETERAYQRGDLLEKRRKLMGAWGEYCSRPTPAGEIVPLRRQS